MTGWKRKLLILAAMLSQKKQSISEGLLLVPIPQHRTTTSTVRHALPLNKNKGMNNDPADGADDKNSSVYYQQQQQQQQQQKDPKFKKKKFTTSQRPSSPFGVDSSNFLEDSTTTAQQKKKGDDHKKKKNTVRYPVIPSSPPVKNRQNPYVTTDPPKLKQVPSPKTTKGSSDGKTAVTNKKPILPNSPAGIQKLQQNNGVGSSQRRGEIPSNDRFRPTAATKGPTATTANNVQQEPDIPERFLGNPYRMEGTQAQRYMEDPSKFQIAKAGKSNNNRQPTQKKQPDATMTTPPDKQERFFDQPYRMEGEQAQRYREDPSRFEIYNSHRDSFRQQRRHRSNNQGGGSLLGSVPDSLDRFMEVPSAHDSGSQADRFRDDPHRFDRNQQVDRYQQDPSRFHVWKQPNHNNHDHKNNGINEMERKRKLDPHSEQHWNLRQGTMHFVENDPNYREWNRFTQDPTVPYKFQERSGQVERFLQNPNRFEIYKPPTTTSPSHHHRLQQRRRSDWQQSRSPVHPPQQQQQRKARPPQSTNTSSRATENRRQRQQQQRQPQPPNTVDSNLGRNIYKFPKDQQIERFETEPKRFVRYKRPSNYRTMPDQVNDFITNPYGSGRGPYKPQEANSIDLDARSAGYVDEYDRMEELVVEKKPVIPDYKPFFGDDGGGAGGGRQRTTTDTADGGRDRPPPPPFDPQYYEKGRFPPQGEEEKRPYLGGTGYREQNTVQQANFGGSGPPPPGVQGNPYYMHYDESTVLEHDPYSPGGGGGGSAYQDWKKGDDRPGMYWKEKLN